VSSARKPVIVRKLNRDWCAGYAAANPTAEPAGLEMLDTSGKLICIDWEQVKWVCYVREPGAGDSFTALHRISGEITGHPERLLRRRFSSRPRVPGVWLRLTLADGEELEGVAANDRSLVDGAGLLLIPPDTRSNTQRVFIPRSAIRDFTVLGVISPLPDARRTGGQQPDPQPELFEKDPGNERLA